MSPRVLLSQYGGDQSWVYICLTEISVGFTYTTTGSCTTYIHQQDDGNLLGLGYIYIVILGLYIGLSFSA